MKKVILFIFKTLLFLLALTGSFLTFKEIRTFLDALSMGLGYVNFYYDELISNIIALFFEIGYCVLFFKNGYAKTWFNFVVVEKEVIKEHIARQKTAKKQKEKDKLTERLNKLESDE